MKTLATILFSICLLAIESIAMWHAIENKRLMFGVFCMTMTVNIYVVSEVLP
jgi:hypothetical protein